jgi:O-succinylbenzoate synthase
MKFDYQLYRLQFRSSYGVVGERSFREGALLRVAFDDGLVGYCDCHPWSELGDLPLAKQLKNLASAQLTPLLSCSLQFARMDAEARRQGASVFKGLKIPPSHQLVSLSESIGPFLEEKITCFKLKVGASPNEEIAVMTQWVQEHPEIHLRLDFNQKIARHQFLEYWQKIPCDVQQAIQFVEDPYLYDVEAWSKDQKQLQIPFAADRAASLATFEAAKIIIHKPAIEPICKLFNPQMRLVVTSYLDHPFGQMCAAYIAAKLADCYPQQILDCGLLSHRCYEKHSFADDISSKGPNLYPAEGTGFGFDTLLEGTIWQNL